MRARASTEQLGGRRLLDRCVLAIVPIPSCCTLFLSRSVMYEREDREERARVWSWSWWNDDGRAGEGLKNMTEPVVVFGTTCYTFERVTGRWRQLGSQRMPPVAPTSWLNSALCAVCRLQNGSI